MFSYVLARLLRKLRPSAIRGSQIHRTAAIESGSQIVNTSFGRHSFCGYDCVVLNTTIGSFCSIADQVYIGGSQHPAHFVSTSPVFLSHRDSVTTKLARHPYHNMPRTFVGSDVWIGFAARIKAGVTIGDGAIIGMGSVVTRDVEPYAIVAGNPARLVRKRFSEPVVDGLLKSRWWELEDEHIRQFAEMFTDPEAFLDSQRNS